MNSLECPDGSTCVKNRLRRIMLLGDMHATRITLAVAEIMMGLGFIINSSNSCTERALVMIGPLWVWVPMLIITGGIQAKILCSGKYHGKIHTVFAAWEVSLWMFLSSASYGYMGSWSGPQLALTLAAGWLFVSSGYSARGKRSSDYGL